MGNLADDWMDGGRRKFYTMPYCKAGETPGWDSPRLRTVFRDTGTRILNVVECNPREGWLKRYLTDREGKFIIRDQELVVETLKGYFEIRIYTGDPPP